MNAPEEQPLRRILFVCVENACRSQMAAGFAQRQAEPGVEVWSAGSEPAEEVNPRAVAFMKDRGIELGDAVPRSVEELPEGTFELVVSMGCGDQCPTVPAKRREEWAIPDPKHLPDDEFRAVRDEIEARVGELMRTVGGGT